MFSTGEYRVGAVLPSAAPSMDIQVASNFERFIYAGVGRDPARVREVMATFKATGAYRFEQFDRGIFSSSCCTDAEIPAIIARVLREDGYLVDPHTACGFKELNPDRVSVVLATASPAKFPETIQTAVGIEPKHPSLEALKSRPIKKHLIKATPAAITAFIERYAV
jgi:threonine synthase